MSFQTSVQNNDTADRNEFRNDFPNDFTMMNTHDEFHNTSPHQNMEIDVSTEILLIHKSLCLSNSHIYTCMFAIHTIGTQYSLHSQ